jgi:hypothetical protein
VSVEDGESRPSSLVFEWDFTVSDDDHGFTGIYRPLVVLPQQGRAQTTSTSMLVARPALDGNLTVPWE